MKYLFFLLAFICANAQALVINLDAEIRVSQGKNKCSAADKLIDTKFQFYEDPKQNFAGWIGIVAFKPVFYKPERIPAGGLDLSKAKASIFPLDNMKDCRFASALGKINGTEEDEIGLIFVGDGCKVILEKFKNDEFAEFGIEWDAVPMSDGEGFIDGVTMNVFNPCKSK